VLAELGQVVLLAALLASLVLGVLPFIGARRNDATLMATAPLAAWAQAVLVAAAFMLLA
jgi:cytochrome c-type biogenesis protein CcmF